MQVSTCLVWNFWCDLIARLSKELFPAAPPPPTRSASSPVEKHDTGPLKHQETVHPQHVLFPTNSTLVMRLETIGRHESAIIW